MPYHSAVEQLRGVLFRSMTSNGLLLDQHFDRVVQSRLDKVHLSIHFPENPLEVERVERQVTQLAAAGIRSGVNLLITRQNVAAARRVARRLRDAGIGNDRIVYLPMRGQDTPTSKQVSQVAGDEPFQSMTCLRGCSASD